MIVVTGVGRSGTSLLARLYQQLGFDPGGTWFPEWKAGLEDEEIVRLNQDLIRELGVGLPERHVPEPLRAARLLVPAPVRRFIAERFLVLPEIITRRPEVRWDRFGRAVRRYGGRLQAAAEGRQVVKDPRFSWTLGVWAAAGASIEHVLICVRNVEAAVDSRIRVGHLPRRARYRTRNAQLYQLGLLMGWVHDHRLGHAVLRFPDFLKSPDELHEVMRFPTAVTKERFLEAFERVVDLDLVQDWR